MFANTVESARSVFLLATDTVVGRALLIVSALLAVPVYFVTTVLP